MWSATRLAWKLSWQSTAPVSKTSWARIPFRLDFFRLKFYNCLSCVYYCDDQLCPFISFSAVQIYDISYIHFYSRLLYFNNTFETFNLKGYHTALSVSFPFQFYWEAQTFSLDVSLIQKSYNAFLCLHCRWKNRRNIQTRIWKRWLSLHGLKTRFLWQHLSLSLLNGQLSWCHSGSSIVTHDWN